MSLEPNSVPAFGSGREHQRRYYQYGPSTPNPNDDDNVAPAAGELFTDTTPIDIHYDEDHGAGDTDFQWTWTGRSFKRLLQFVGPGWLMSIAYIDSGNLESDIQAGALCGYSLLWILFWSTLIGWLIQSLCARLSVVTGKSLSELCRYEYNHSVSVMIWLFVELSIIGNDIQQVIGTAIAFHILFGLKLWIGCILTVVTAFLMLAINSWKGHKWMEYFFLAVIASMSVLFVVECGMVGPNFWLILKGKGFIFCDSIWCKMDFTMTITGSGPYSDDQTRSTTTSALRHSIYEPLPVMAQFIE